MACNRGNVCDHALFLCSLLLGFGLNAYIAIGTSEDEPHMWVLTKNKKDGKNLMFWESVLGQRYSINDPKITERYQTVNCVFNNKEFYANLQLDDRVGKTSLNFADKKCWRSINKKIIDALLPWNMDIRFTEPDNIDQEEEEKILEAKLKDLIRSYRAEHNTIFDEKLEDVLSMAVESYEFERIYGKPLGENEFGDTIRSLTPNNYVFKAYPIQVRELNHDKVFDEIMRSDVI